MCSTLVTQVKYYLKYDTLAKLKKTLKLEQIR